MGKTLGIMFTFTTYGTWLPGDRRGYVDRGIVFPPSPPLEEMSRRRLRFQPFRFPQAQRHAAGACVGQAAQALGLPVFALCVGSCHVHLVTGPVSGSLGEVVKKVKSKVRGGLRYRRAVWGAGYDKRFCFDQESLRNRITYVRRHNIQDNLPPSPWGFIVSP